MDTKNRRTTKNRSASKEVDWSLEWKTMLEKHLTTVVVAIMTLSVVSTLGVLGIAVMIAKLLKFIN